ncbi:hypothetical protein STAFG_8495 [Streptomyces afghaniensis 772]|uniref:Uncharacterized protein n=1 Tax=Streptomyces afghaniensis 772 TaxID=1283301 RepID=S4N9K8_9ACTN|nr:hypothetical protein STAFG_8495 [Streptomyces afghaniensis 772]
MVAFLGAGEDAVRRNLEGARRFSLHGWAQPG